MRKLAGERGQTSAELAGVLLLVAAIVTALVLVTDVDRRIAEEARQLVCRIAHGGPCGEVGRPQRPERCLESSTTRTSSASVLIAVVRLDKDSTLIRENYSDGTARFIILDNSEVAGELFAGVKGKIAKYGVNYSASADAGLALAGARVFELPSQPAADAFQERLQAAGGFDGILRDLASYNDEIPLVGWDNPVGGLDDWALDRLGVDDDEDLPAPNETYVEGRAFVSGHADLGGGVGVLDGELAGMIEGAGVVKVTTAGENRGDAEFTVELGGELDGTLTAATLGGGLGGDAKFTATITLDAQNGYKADKLVIKGTAGYVGTLDVQAALQGDELEDIASALEEVSLSGNAGEGQGVEFSAELDLEDPQNLAATLDVIRSAANPAAQAPAVAALAARLNSDGTLALDTYDVESSETEGEIKVGVGIGGGGGAGSSTESETGRRGRVRSPGGTFQPRLCRRPPA